MGRIKTWIKNRKYSSRMLFFLSLSVLSLYFINDRYHIDGSVTEIILTPPEYENYQRLMLIPITLMAIVPILFGMWFKEEQLKRKGRLIPEYVSLRVKDLEISNDHAIQGASTNDKNDSEEEYDFEYTI